jgi:hypothetical protein
LSNDSPAQLSADGQEVIYITPKLSSKLIMIESLFQ